MKKYLAILFSTLAFCAAPAFAQDTRGLDPAAVTAAKQLFDSMRFRQVMTATTERMVAVMPEQMRSQLTQTINNNPRMSPEQKQKALADLERDLPKMTARARAVLEDPALQDDMIAEVIPLYSRNFTAAEIEQMAAFYRSPVGQKMLAKMPTIAAEMMQAMTRIMSTRVQRHMDEVAQSFVGQNL